MSKDLCICLLLAAGALRFAAGAEISLSARFIGDKPPERAMVDVPMKLDMRSVRGIRFDFKCENAALFQRFTCHFRSGKGWYCASFTPSGGDGKWGKVEIDKSEVGMEGAPEGWRSVDLVRISGWRLGIGETRCAIKDLHPIDGAVSRIVVLQGESCAALSQDHRVSAASFARTVAAGIRSLGQECLVLGETDLTDELLADKDVVVLPFNPKVPPPAAAVLRRFADAGGRLFVMYGTTVAVAEILGVRWQKWVKLTGEERAEGLVRSADGIEGQPAFTQNVTPYSQVFEPLAGTKTAAYWGLPDGRHGKIPAMMVSDKGVYLAYPLQDCTAGERRRLLAAVLSRLAPRVASSIRDAMGRAEVRARATRDRIAAIPAGRQGEFRAVWCHDPNGLGDGRGWNETVRIVKECGFNALFANLAWGGAAAYESEHLPLTQRMKGLKGADADKFAACQQACRQHGVAFHAWKVCWNLGWGTPKWFVEKMRYEDRTQVSFSGQAVDWLCPSNPENLKLEVEVALELARRHPDGIHFDYVRYPDGNGCHCNGCRRRFESRIGTSVPAWPGDLRRNPELAQAWERFRADNISAVVREASRRIRRECPGVQLSAAVFSDCSPYPVQVAQNWPAWCRERILDFVCPMDYLPTRAFKEVVSLQRKSGGATPLRPGIGVPSVSSCSTEDAALVIAEQMSCVRSQGLDGFSVFSLETRTLEALRLLSVGPMSR